MARDYASVGELFRLLIIYPEQNGLPEQISTQGPYPSISTARAQRSRILGEYQGRGWLANRTPPAITIELANTVWEHVE